MRHCRDAIGWELSVFGLDITVPFFGGLWLECMDEKEQGSFGSEVGAFSF